MVWKTRGGVVLVTMVLACTAQPESDDTLGLATTGGPQTTTDVTATTIPLPSDESSSSAAGTGDGTSTGEADSTGGGSESGSTGSEQDSGSTTDPSGGSSSEGSMTVYDVEWCRLQFPPSVDVAVGEVFTVYVRLFSPGLTDQTGVTDPAPELVVEVGYGVDGSDPSMGIGMPWTYVPAIPNGGYGPGAPDYSAANDEYQADVSIGMAGIYDYAPRISGDGGMTWVWCDFDGLDVGGYTPDQAGQAEIGQ